MLFHVLRERLLDEIRLLVSSGAYTERGLARHLGVSQPHLHNVLAGVRTLTVELADHILVRLEIPWSQIWPDEERPCSGK